MKAQNRGIDADTLRDDIAPAVLGKRLSEANAREIVKLLGHVTALYKAPASFGELTAPKRYGSSRAGLVAELEDVARARWGVDYEKSLNAFVNSKSIKAVTHYRFLDVAALKGLKERIKELNRYDRP
ncbi:hypothetical protein EPN18_10080 [bacterium]|nr:MAG: hypothetical protein EPN18_10080 [bacterium]